MTDIPIWDIEVGAFSGRGSLRSEMKLRGERTPLKERKSTSRSIGL